jgi:hypothetical protein
MIFYFKISIHVISFVYSKMHVDVFEHALLTLYKFYFVKSQH